jgi:hypothetical protein
MGHGVPTVRFERPAGLVEEEPVPGGVLLRFPGKLLLGRAQHGRGVGPERRLEPGLFRRNGAGRDDETDEQDANDSTGHGPSR